MDNFKVSVIVPVYNSCEYIGSTLDSIINQDFKSFELIVIDDCSRDHTFQLICEWAEKDHRILALRNDVNSGVAKTRNRGIDLAKGQYIAFLDSDDLWLPKKLEKQLGFMVEHNYEFSYTLHR